MLTEIRGPKEDEVSKDLRKFHNCDMTGLYSMDGRTNKIIWNLIRYVQHTEEIKLN